MTLKKEQLATGRKRADLYRAAGTSMRSQARSARSWTTIERSDAVPSAATISSGWHRRDVHFESRGALRSVIARRKCAMSLGYSTSVFYHAFVCDLAKLVYNPLKGIPALMRRETQLKDTGFSFNQNYRSLELFNDLPANNPDPADPDLESL